MGVVTGVVLHEFVKHRRKVSITLGQQAVIQLFSLSRIRYLKLNAEDTAARMATLQYINFPEGFLKILHRPISLVLAIICFVITCIHISGTHSIVINLIKEPS